MRRRLFQALLLLCGIAVPWAAHAHEAYVLPHSFFWQAMGGPISLHALDALKNPHDLRLTVIITLSVIALFVLNFLFRRSRAGMRFHAGLERFAWLGPQFVRIAIAAAFFYSAFSWSFLGPELPIASMPMASAVRILLFVCSGLIALGLLTELAAAIAFILFTISWSVFGLYMATYLNYLGEIIVLLLFGLRSWSLDSLWRGRKIWLERWKRYDTVIVRIFYGLALAYAAVNVKFLHPALTLRVVNDWNLTQFHWLFPSDPLLVVLGAGLAELAIGLFIIFGFQMRLTVLISLFYITLSLLYFRELVWPHLMLYGISLSLLVQPETFTLDHWLFASRRSR